MLFCYDMQAHVTLASCQGENETPLNSLDSRRPKAKLTLSYPVITDGVCVNVLSSSPETWGKSKRLGKLLISYDVGGTVIRFSLSQKQKIIHIHCNENVTN